MVLQEDDLGICTSLDVEGLDIDGQCWLLEHDTPEHRYPHIDPQQHRSQHLVLSPDFHSIAFTKKHYPDLRKAFPNLRYSRQKYYLEAKASSLVMFSIGWLSGTSASMVFVFKHLHWSTATL
jgi:hypothetical protein